MTSKIETSMVGMIDKIKEPMNSMVDHIKTSMSKAGSTISKRLTVSPTEKLLGQIKTERSGTGESLSTDLSKSSKKIKTDVGSATTEVSKSIGKIKKDSIGLIPTSGIKSSFKTIGEIGSKTLAMLAVRSATSWI